MVVTHDEIPSYMDAMTMEFVARDPGEIADLLPGDIVEFSLVVADRESRAESIRKVGTGGAVSTQVPTPGGTPQPASLPDVTLIDQDGKPFHLQDLRGKALAISFIFTRCPLPDYCPKTSEQFEAVQAELSQGADDRWQLLSITIDPAFDTPERLRAYGSRYHAKAGQWTLATGDVTDLSRLASAFDVGVAGQGAALTHTTRTIVVDPSGSIRKTYGDNRWQPSELVSEMKGAMSGAPELR